MLVAAAVAFAACDKIEDEKPADTGMLSITLVPNLQTKASTDVLAYENQLNKMKVLVYDKNNVLYKELELSSPFLSTTIPDIKADTYQIYAVANSCAALSSCITVADLAGTAVSLSDCSTNAGTGFLMYGSKTDVVVVAGNTATPVTMNVMRFPARIRLLSVKNSLPASLGVLTLENVMLVNGFSSWNLDASGSPGSPVNPAGRTNEGSGEIVGTSAEADMAEYSFKAVTTDRDIDNGETRTCGYNFYSFPNTVATDRSGARTAGGKMRLVVKAKYNGRSYYYPVTLDAVERNKCYDVALNISGAGSVDPNVPVEKGSINVSVSVSDWEQGADYTETI